MGALPAELADGCWDKKRKINFPEWHRVRAADICKKAWPALWREEDPWRALFFYSKVIKSFGSVVGKHVTKSPSGERV